MVNERLLIFDGDCGFCTSSARWIERRWPDNTADAIPWQSLSEEHLTDLGLTHDDVTTKAWWSDGDAVRGGERAVAAALRGAGGLWGVAGRLIDRAPLRWLAVPAYRLVARYRYKLPGSTPACRLGP